MNWEKLIFMLILSIIFSLLVASACLIFNAIYIMRMDNAAGKLLESRDAWEKRVNHIYEAVFGDPIKEVMLKKNEAKK